MTELRFSSLKGRPVVFGEVLFDIFPDGREVLGGAPFNVARHLHGFELEPLFISRVGDDRRGELVREAMTQWDMDLSGLQSDPHHPTGSVTISMQGTQHSFEILAQQAYDYIEPQPAVELLQQQTTSLLYFGSLIEREATSRTTLQQLRTLPVRKFSDVNLRAPWWQSDQVRTLLNGVDWVKLNDEELTALGFDSEIDKAARRMRAEFDLELLIVTRGAQGAMFVTTDDILHGTPAPIKHLVDTVGAGDAFSSVVLLGIQRGWPLHKTLQYSLEFAAHICEVRGAVLPDNSYYEACLAKWDR
jgi:fructokinase